jgi:hypothetical protein
MTHLKLTWVMVMTGLVRMRTSDTKMLQKKKLQQAEEDDVQNLNFQL